MSHSYPDRPRQSQQSHRAYRLRQRTLPLLLVAILGGQTGVATAATLQGRIHDLNGQPVSGAMITVSGHGAGATALTVFSADDGSFAFPGDGFAGSGEGLEVSLRALGHELVERRSTATAAQLNLQLLVRSTSNQAAVAPASAWLKQLSVDETATFILDCIGCHQVPAPEFRAYANAIADIPGHDRADISRQGWDALIKYMNFISAEEFGRGPGVEAPDALNVYSVGNDERVLSYLTRSFPGRMNELQGHDWGAPLAVTPATVIREYELPRPNAVREALLLGEPPQLYVADVASNTIFTVDPQTGFSGQLQVPSDIVSGPHSLHRGADDALWIAPFVSSVVARLDTATQDWRTWPMRTADGRATGIHDLSFGSDHTLLTDKDGNIWFSDIANNAVGYLDPDTGEIGIYPAPQIEGRAPNGAMYGLVMSADREQLWFSQLAIGVFGSFNIRTRSFEASEVLAENAGPRRLAISDEDVLYVPLYGSGQLVEYDARSKRRIGIYDLPDRASAPYAVTWDPVRKVVWIPTSNGDVLYRFDPRDKSFAALPMPRAGALLRMVDVDPDTGWLITSYGNIVENVHGPRMALIIEPGDDAYAAP